MVRNTHFERTFVASLLLVLRHGLFDAVEELDRAFEHLCSVVPSQVIGSAYQTFVVVFHQIGRFAGIRTILADGIGFSFHRRVALDESRFHAVALISQ